jgi:NAD(P)-dependent dehydrogenase (short-subunit alcohol dehydrogenase family)
VSQAVSGPGGNARPDLPLAVVVGAGGMAMAVARRLGPGHRLLIADRDGEHLARQVARLDEEGHDAVGLRCDLTSAGDVAALAEQAAAAGPVKVLANVVGLSVAAGDFDLIMRVNLIGAARVAEAFLPVLAPGGCGVFVSSSSAHMSPVAPELWPLLDAPTAPDFLDRLHAALGDKAEVNLAYPLSKAALNRMCLRLAAPWGRRGLRIFSMSPGLIATPMGAEAYKHSAGKRKLFDAVPVGREATMLEVADLVAFLVSDRASYLSGTDILMDGGLIAALRFPEA